MSTGAECRFNEISPGIWTYWLQDYPYGETEEGATHGPFGSFFEAREDLQDNYGNPGGWWTGICEGHVHEFQAGDWNPTTGKYEANYVSCISCHQAKA